MSKRSSGAPDAQRSLRRRPRAWVLGGIGALLLIGLAGPRLVEAWWRHRSANPVRRGVHLARQLGCFSCHRELGGSGIPIPGAAGETVPGWSGGVWMMYVQNDDDIRDFIRFGSAGREAQGDPDHEHARITMPAYGEELSGRELEDLVAAFKVLAGMSLPRSGTAARAGHELASQWDCFSCHGPAASGGLPNPRSFTGFIPGWYGPDFDELVRGREEFDTWVRDGGLPRLERHPIAGRFQRRQRIQMPAYSELTREELDRLWAYVLWLKETGGGYAGVSNPW